jgi:hypothetical protein
MKMTAQYLYDMLAAQARGSVSYIGPKTRLDSLTYDGELDLVDLAAAINKIDAHEWNS